MPCPVLGRVCMDQMMVDVSALPDVQEGDEAILWGGEVSDSAETIAHKTDTISYEVLCGVSAGSYAFTWKTAASKPSRTGSYKFRRNYMAETTSATSASSRTSTTANPPSPTASSS